MKKIKKFWIIFLVILQVGLPTFSSLLLATETVYATENSTSETSEKTKETEATDDATASSTNSSAKPVTDKETTSSSVEKSVTDETTQEENKESNASSTTSESTEPQKSIATSDLIRAGQYTFDATIQTESDTGIVALPFRNDSDTEKAIANWKILRNVGYNLQVVIEDYPSGSAANSRQVRIKIPRGLIVPITDLESIKANPNVKNYTIEDKTHVVVNQINSNFRQTTYMDNVNGTNTHSKNYVTGSTIVFDLEPDRGAEGFSFRVLPNFEDGSENSPNFWTGVSGDSLTRHQPIVVDFVENNTLINKKILDDIVIPSAVSYPVVTGNPSVSGSTTPGTQTLDKVMNIYIQPRVRNNTENSSSNAFYMGNTTYKTYVPYKKEKLANGKYLSAKLETEEMDAWIARITGNNPQIIDYSFEEQPDGRIIVTYYFLDDQKEYLIQSPNLQMYYSYPSQEDENGNKFAPNDVIVYTQNNLGQTFHNYRYNSDGTVTMEESLVRPLTDSTTEITITDENEFKLEFLARPASHTYSTIALKDSEATVLLDYALITNKSPAKGDTRVEYKIDTENKWKYGVTTIQFWTVDSTYGGSVEESRKYTYNFDFVLQKKGSDPGEDILTGTYSLTPKDEYKDVQINRDNGAKRDLLGYLKGNAEERYFYYVNREMLAKGIEDERPADFNLNDYYIKELSYDLYVSAAEGENYISGISDRPKESGGQLYGHTFGNDGDTGKNHFSITPTDKPGKKLEKTHTTKLIAESSGYDLTTFLKDTMTVKNEAGTEMTTSAHRVSVGDKVSVSASALSCFYPYGLLSYSPDPVFIIRTPIDLDLDTESITLQQEQEGVVVDLNFTIEEQQEPLSDGSKIYYVTPTNSNGIGFYNENRNEIGEAIAIDYQMTVNIAARAQPINYKELLFVADKNFKNGTGGSYSGYAKFDEWGIANSTNNQVAFFYPTSGGQAQLMTTNVGHMFNTNQPVLDFDLGSSLNLEADVNNEKTGGVIDDKDRDFTATFSMSNTKQSGYVDKEGMLVFYIPIPKAGNNLPEWIKGDQKHEFSLSLTGPIVPTSTMGVDYEVRYTTESSLRFDNGLANFDGSTTHAAYVPYDDVMNNLEAVTMVKVIARIGDENKHIIPFGEKMTAEIPLAYSSSNSSGATFEERTGQKTAWTPYVVQRYTLGSATNEFKTLAPESSVRIRYRKKFEREIWAYNTDDYPSGEHEGIPMDKKIDIDLPKFLKKFNLQIDELKMEDIINMVLNEKSKFDPDSSDKSVSFGNENFGFEVGLNNNGLYDLHGALNGTISLGSTGSLNSLHYQIYNGDNITETSSDRSITIKYNSIVDGEVTDDIEFEVTLIIRRRASIIDAVTALVAGKEYRTFTAAEKNKITLQDGAFTAQFAYNTEYLKAQLPNITADNKIYLEFGSIGLPPGDTILMKVQSSDSNGNLRPEYYFYKNPGDNLLPKKQIELTSFIKMGTEESLSIKDISRHIDDADLLSYLFIFDFSNSKNAEIVENDTISLISDIPSWDNTEGPKFNIDPLREIKNSTESLVPTEYEQKEPIDIRGKITLDPLKVESLTAGLVDAYNKDKQLSLSVSLYDSAGKRSWPQGSMIQIGDKLITPVNVEGDLQFIYPASEIKNDLVDLDYEFKVLTDLEPLATGNYRIRVEVFRDLSQTHPLGGDEIRDTETINFSVGASTSGLKVSSNVEERLVYSRTSGQSADITIGTEGISKVTTTLEKKIGVDYEAASDAGAVLTTDLSPEIQINQDGSKLWTVNFENRIATAENGEYRIVFKGYNKDDELLYETNWTFIVCDPPN